MNKKTIAVIAALCFVYPLYAEDTKGDIVDKINFLDDEVKALCVANWDDDGDGELSMDEAAAVTALGNVFRENKNIVTFEELRYFTGLTAIDDYAFYKSSIEKVTFPESVKTIGEYAFSQSNISGELHIPGTVTEIKNYAFDTCLRLSVVVLEEGVEIVGWHSFSGPISTLSLPASLTFIKSMAIDPYVNAGTSSGIFLPEGDLWVFTHSEEPADINYFAFYFLFGDGHLVVPSGTIESYRSVDGWSQFNEYIERGDVNADGSVNYRDLTLLTQYLDGEKVTLKNYYLGDINTDGVVDENDLLALDDLLCPIYGIATDMQTAVDAPTASSSAIYSLDGRMVARDRSALSSLPNGIYICQGRKIVVKN